MLCSVTPWRGVGCNVVDIFGLHLSQEWDKIIIIIYIIMLHTVTSAIVGE